MHETRSCAGGLGRRVRISRTQGTALRDPKVLLSFSLPTCELGSITKQHTVKKMVQKVNSLGIQR